MYPRTSGPSLSRLAALLLLAGAILAGPTAVPPARAAVASSSAEAAEVRYGHIVERREQAPNSNVTAGALIGGLVGLATAGGKSSSTKATRAVGGALLGGVIANQVDRSKRHYLYTIRFPDGSEEQTLMQDGRLSLGDCASVAYGRTETRVHYSSDYFCEREARAARASRNSAPVAADDPCREARRRLLDATDPAEIEVLSEKVRIICG